MKQNGLLIFVFFIMFAITGKIKFDSTEISRCNKILIDSVLVLKREISVIDSSFQRQAQINLKLRGEKSESEEKELQQDKRYMELVTPKQD